jgi:hypothetical protein
MTKLKGYKNEKEKVGRNTRKQEVHKAGDFSVIYGNNLRMMIIHLKVKCFS